MREKHGTQPKTKLLGYDNAVIMKKIKVPDARKRLEALYKKVDDFVDTLELLSDPKFRKNLEQGLKQVRQNKTAKLSTRDLKKRYK